MGEEVREKYRYRYKSELTLLRKVHCAAEGRRDERVSDLCRRRARRRETEEETYMVVGMVDAVIAQPAMTSPRRPIGLARLAPCEYQESADVIPRLGPSSSSSEGLTLASHNTLSNPHIPRLGSPPSVALAMEIVDPFALGGEVEVARDDSGVSPGSLALNVESRREIGEAKRGEGERDMRVSGAQLRRKGRSDAEPRGLAMLVHMTAHMYRNTNMEAFPPPPRWDQRNGPLKAKKRTGRRMASAREMMKGVGLSREERARPWRKKRLEPGCSW